MLNWDKECDCVNREAIKNSGGTFEEYEYSKAYNIPPDVKKLTLKPIDPDLLRKCIKNLQLSTEYIADGITAWCTWPEIEGHHCSGCGAEMNVLGMSYDHWCPLCDPNREKSACVSMSHNRQRSFDYPVFGPSIDTIREGGRLADDMKRRKERDR